MVEAFSLSVEYCLRTADDEVDVWLLKVDKPIEVFNRLLEKAGEEASEQNRPGDVVLHVEEGLDRFTIYYVYGRRESFMLTALLAREGVELQVNAKDMLAEELANLILKSTLNLELPKLTEEEKKHKTLEFRERLNREERLKKIKNSITDFDLKVLELRSRGYSLLGIALELGATISKIRYSLQKLAQIPEYRNKLGKYTPKPRRKS
jgi:hypothetical protein